MNLLLRIVIIAMSLSAAMPSVAQTVRGQAGKKPHGRTVLVHGTVVDAFTKAALKAHVTLMEADSTVIDTATCWQWELSSGYNFTVRASERDLIVRATLGGYEPACVRFSMRHIGRNTDFEMPRCEMRRKADDDIYKDVSLDGVTVTGTKVKIAWRGDTVVYNASAFNLPEGSMLDALVRQLPGAQLKPNGDILVNGKKIDYLMLNGKDFFKGNNRVMLDNLPYYTVRSLKVYHRQSERSRWMEQQVERKDYVMDVELKREYERGYITSVEAGAGTHGRWLGRLFSLAYSGHTRLSAFGSANNVSDSQSAGDNGDWLASYSPVGESTARIAGMNLNAEDRDKRFNETLSAELQWNTSSNESRTSSQTFAPQGDIYGRSLDASRQRIFTFNASNSFVVDKPFKLQSFLSVGYTNSRSRFTSFGATFGSSPAGCGDFMQVIDSVFSTGIPDHLLSMLTNRSSAESISRRRALQVSGNVSLMHKLPWGDKLVLTLVGNANNAKPAERFGHNAADYMQSGKSDFRNIYADTHSSDYYYSARLSYVVALPGGWSFDPAVEYAQSGSVSNDATYRLERLAHQWASPQAAIGLLPSTRDSLQMAFDASNSTWANNLKRQQRAGITISRSDERMFLNVNLPLVATSEQLGYRNAATDTVARRSYLTFSPDAYVTYHTDRAYISGGYRMSRQVPDLVSLMPSVNDANPLARRISNPNLKSPVSHGVYASVSYDRRDRHKQSATLSANFGTVVNAYAMRTRYATATGAYTSMRDNVNGNWNISTSLGYTCMPDSANRVTLSATTTADYSHSVGYATAYDDADFSISRVGNLEIGQTLNASYSYGNLDLGASASLTWRNSRGDRPDFTTINAVDYNYGANASWRLPFGLRVSTDIKVRGRRGYQDRAMNTDEMVWNASFGCSFLKNRLTLTLDAYDLLHQLSSTDYHVDAQGRTETWRRTVSAYAMFRVGYRFEIMPGNKKSKGGF